MGISMSVYQCTDAQIHDFSQDVSRLNNFLSQSPGRGDCYLADFWDGLHYLLTRGVESPALPLTALKVGDVAVQGATEATHAIFNRTTQRFAGELQSLSEAALRERFDPGQMVEARIYPVRPWLFPEHAEG